MVKRLGIDDLKVDLSTFFGHAHIIEHNVIKLNGHLAISKSLRIWKLHVQTFSIAMYRYKDMKWITSTSIPTWDKSRLICKQLHNLQHLCIHKFNEVPIRHRRTKFWSHRDLAFSKLVDLLCLAMFAKNMANRKRHFDERLTKLEVARSIVWMSANIILMKCKFDIPNRHIWLSCVGWRATTHCHKYAK